MLNIAVYTNIFICLLSFLQYVRTIQKASEIEYNLQLGDEYYQWINDKAVHRLILRLKLGIRLIMSILGLIWCSNRLYPVLLPYETPLMACSSCLFFICMLLDSQIMYLTYSRSNFNFFRITKIHKNDK